MYHFLLFNLFPVPPPQIFQVQIQPVFPDHLSVSYDYGARNLDEYFHFYTIAGQKFKFEGNIF